MNYSEDAMRLHRQYSGKLEVASRVPLETKDDLSTAYTPGVAEPCLEIARNPEAAWDLTMRGRTVAIVTDGSAVLGLGNIGALAGLPVMEGKAVIYKRFAGVDAWPIILDTQEAGEIVETVKHVALGFGAIHLEDISAPRCFEVEERLRAELSIPVLHDDQHATATVVLAGLLNALKVVGKSIDAVRVVISGAGAAGIATAHLLADAGVRSIRVLDTRGVIFPGRGEGMHVYKDRLAEGLFALDGADYGRDLAGVLRGADVFIGVSQPNLVDQEMVQSMAPGAVVFALANPVPEIMPDVARAAGASVVGSGRSDFPNQVNNALVYPGLFLGVLEARARAFTPEVMQAAAKAVAALVSEPTPEKILPTMFETNLSRIVADAVKEAL